MGAIGGLLTLVGAILVILGRKAFGATHRRNVVISIVLFFVGILFVFIGGVIAGIVAVGALSGTATEAQLAVSLRDALTNILIVAAVGSFVSGLASVFFTYALQKREGRILLWAAYGATAALQVAILVVTLPLIPDIAATIAHSIVTTQTVNAAEIANAVSGATAGLSYLSVIPSLLYAGANYFAWNRINTGEILPPTAPTPTPMGPPGPPTPPS